MNKSVPSSGFNIYSWIIFGLIFTYLVLRAILLEPLHDESGTFLNYIEPEAVYGKGVVQDANNHLLNTFLGTLMHHFFGTSFFLFRLPNVLCFALYFWGVYQLVKPIREAYFKFILLTALVTIPFMVEYFAYTRGYGMGIAFFIWMLIYSQKWMENPEIKYAALLFIFCLLAVFSNLIFMVSACLSLALVALVHLQYIRQWKMKKTLFLISLYFLFLLGLCPFVFFSYLLKMGGALYYGSLDGFWEVTVKTLVRYVIFYDADWQKWIWLALILAFVFSLLYLFVQKGLWKALQEKVTVLGWYFLGNIAAILVLANFFQVNYPEDRVGMYLIPLAILIFGFSIVKTKAQPLIIVLLFFPISFVWKMNLNTSVFSPEDRISKHFYEEVKKELGTETTMAIYPMMHLSWPMHERRSVEIKFQPCIERHFSPLYDVFISKRKLIKPDHNQYELICEDIPGGIAAYKRKNPFQKILLHCFQTGTEKSRQGKIPLLQIPLTDSLKRENLLLKISGAMKVDQQYKDIRFFVCTYDQAKKLVREIYFDQRWPHGLNDLDFEVHINCVLGKISAQETELRLYIWNPQYSTLSFKNGKTHFYKLIE